MGKVISELSMSLDGYIAGPHDGPENGLGDGGEALFRWYEAGDVPFVVPNGEMTFHVSAASAALLAETYPTFGALVTGRRTFDITNGWEGRHTVDVPVVVVTHEVPEAWVEEYVVGRGAPFTFVTEGVARAVAVAREIAGDKNVSVGAASLVQQCLSLGLLDEIQIDLAPVLLGGGVRLFDHLEGVPIALERLRVVEGRDVTHLLFRVVRA